MSGSCLDRLRHYLIENNLRRDDRLPAERTLAEVLKVSRSSLREAIRALTVLEVLVSRQGDGTYVKVLANLPGSWPESPRLDEIDFDLMELLEVRKMIEPSAAALAAGRATPEQLRNMREHMSEMAAHVHEIRVREQQDFLFHDAIIHAAGNRLLCKLTDQLTPLLLKSRRATGPAHTDMDRLMRQHEAIYEAIRLGDAELAREAMLRHLLGVGVDLISQPKPTRRKSAKN